MINDLLYFYYHYDSFQEGYLDEKRAREIYEILVHSGRIHMYCGPNQRLLGYAESWRINYEQLGRIVCGHNLYTQLEDENLTDGNIAYLANVTVHPDFRGTEAIKMLRNEFFKANYSCDYFLGHAKRKKHQPWKVFSRQEAYAKWAKEEVSANGRC